MSPPLVALVFRVLWLMVIVLLAHRCLVDARFDFGVEDVLS